MSAKTLERARLIRADADKDSSVLDRTPFTPRGVGETFGILLAMIAALAECVIELAEETA